MSVIDKLVQQLVIQREGVDNDPATLLTSIDMRLLIDVQGGNTKDDEKYKKQLDKSRKLEKELQQTRDFADKDRGTQIKKVLCRRDQVGDGDAAASKDRDVGRCPRDH